MPLYKRKPIVFSTTDSISLEANKSKKGLFFLKATSEVFDDYNDYLQRIHLLRARQWSCRFTGKGGLTYEEATEEENHHMQQLKKFPENLEADVVKAVHHSMLSLDGACNKVYDALKPVVPTDGKENDQSRSKAPKHPLGRTLTRCWIIENCEHVEMTDKRKVWAVKPELAAKHGLPTEWPEGMVPKPKKAQAKGEKAGSTSGSPTAAPQAEKAPTGLGLKKPVKKGPRTLEDQEKSLVAGAAKHIIFLVLKEHGGTKGMNCGDIVKKTIEMKLWSEEEAQKKAKQVGGLLSNHPELFARVDKGLYTLSVFVDGYWEQLDAASAALEAAEAENKANLQSLGSVVGLDGIADGVDAGPSGARAGPSEGPSKVPEQEVDGIPRAELQYKAAQETAAKLRQRLSKVEEDVKATQKALEAEKQLLKTPPKATEGDAGESAAAEAEPDFKLPPELEDYNGDQKDRKALMAWKKARTDALKVLERKKDEWQKEARARKEAKKRGKQDEFKKLQSGAEALRKQLAGAEKAVLDAHKTLMKEQAQVEREKLRQEREAEKEKRRLEALAAKKYPIDDQELMEELAQKAQETGQPAPPTELPTFAVRYSAQESERLELALYVSDFLGQFLKSAATYVGPISKALKLQHLAVYSESLPHTFNLAALDRMLGAGLLEENEGCGPDGEQLDSLYVTLMRFLLEDGEGPMYKLWMNLISEQTWPEVLRRYVLVRDKVDEAPVSERVQFLCALLARSPVDDLHCDQHLTLLQYICDEMLDTERIRELLDKRIEEADDAKRELREGMAEDKKRLRELQEAEKEERKRKREADVAKREALAARRRAVEEVQAEAIKQGKPLDPAEVQRMLEEDVAAAEEEDAMELDEPSFELPEELQEYKGSPNDRKALLQFRQAQQKEQKRLEKERAKWQSEVRQHRKEAEEKRRQAAEAEKAKQKEKQEALEMLQKRQEAFEKEIEKYAIRRQPLGLDRGHRAYWCGLAGQRNVLYAQEADGQWSKCTSISELESIVELLDKRGIREAQLLEAFDKRESAIFDALRKQERKLQAAKAEVEVLPGERVQPGRRGKPADLREQPKEQPAEKTDKPQKDVRTFEARALDWAATEVNDLADNAQRADLPCPEDWQSWKDFHKQVEEAAQGKTPSGEELTGAALNKAILEFLQHSMLALESTVFAASKDGQKDEQSDEESDSHTEEQRPYAGSDEGSEGGKTPNGKAPMDTDDNNKVTLFSPCTLLMKQAEEMEEQDQAGAKDKLKLWASRKLRKLWQSDVSGAATFARLAYCASMINELGQAFLDALVAANEKEKPAGGGKKGQGKEASKGKTDAKENASKANTDKPKETGKRKAAAEPGPVPRATRRRG